MNIAVDGLWRDAAGSVSGVSGIATNVSGRDLALAQITFDVLDATGVKVASAFAVTNGLKAGQRWRFQAVFRNSFSVNVTSIAPGETTVSPVIATDQGPLGTQPFPGNRARLGIIATPVTPALAASAKMGRARGLVIVEVVQASPAARAGLVRGDIVLAYAGKAVDSPSDLQAAIASHGLADGLTIWRVGKQQTVTIIY